MGSRGRVSPTRSRPRRRRRDGGMALLLTLLVLAILVAVTVQFAYSVKTEEVVVENAKEDAELRAAARGSIAFLGALFRDDQKDQKTPAKNVDTLADVWSDPNTAELRKLKVGEVEISLEVEDLDRRLPLEWLVDDKKALYATKALERLMAKCGGVKPDDVEALAKKVQAFVRQKAGKQEVAPGAAGVGATAPATPATGGSTPPPKRTLLAVDQLLDVEGLEPKVLYGDPAATDPPVPGIARFLTTWPVGTVNVNTVSPEVLHALLPQKNAGGEQVWGKEDDIIKAFRGKSNPHRIDPEFQKEQGASGGGSGGAGGTPPAGASDPATTGSGVSKGWSGVAFKDVASFQSHQIHALLGSIFNKAAATPGGATPAPGPLPGSTTGGAAGTSTTSANDPNELFKTLLGVRSRFYVVRVTAAKKDGETETKKVVRLIVARSNADEVAALMVREDAP